jgi:hypothetical protein
MFVYRSAPVILHNKAIPVGVSSHIQGIHRRKSFLCRTSSPPPPTPTPLPHPAFLPFLLDRHLILLSVCLLLPLYVPNHTSTTTNITFSPLYTALTLLLPPPPPPPPPPLLPALQKQQCNFFLYSGSVGTVYAFVFFVVTLCLLRNKRVKFKYLEITELFFALLLFFSSLAAGSVVSCAHFTHFD